MGNVKDLVIKNDYLSQDNSSLTFTNMDLHFRISNYTNVINDIYDLLNNNERPEEILTKITEKLEKFKEIA